MKPLLLFSTAAILLVISMTGCGTPNMPFTTSSTEINGPTTAGQHSAAIQACYDAGGIPLFNAYGWLSECKKVKETK